MEYKFDCLLKEYKQLLEQEQPDAGNPNPPDTAGQAPQDAQPMSPDQNATQPPPSQPVSPAMVFLTNLILQAFKTKQPLYKQDIKFSDNKAQNVNEAFDYLDIVLRNLPETVRQKIESSKGGEAINDIDEGNIVDAANLALKALFYTPKELDTEYHDIASNMEVTEENAKQIYDSINRFFFPNV